MHCKHLNFNSIQLKYNLTSWCCLAFRSRWAWAFLSNSFNLKGGMRGLLYDCIYKRVKDGPKAKWYVVKSHERNRKKERKNTYCYHALLRSGHPFWSPRFAFLFSLRTIFSIPCKRVITTYAELNTCCNRSI